MRRHLTDDTDVYLLVTNQVHHKVTADLGNTLNRLTGDTLNLETFKTKASSVGLLSAVVGVQGGPQALTFFWCVPGWGWASPRSPPTETVSPRPPTADRGTPEDWSGD